MSKLRNGQSVERSVENPSRLTTLASTTESSAIEWVIEGLTMPARSRQAVAAQVGTFPWRMGRQTHCPSLERRNIMSHVSRHFAAAAVIGLCMIPATAARAEDEDRNDKANRYVITISSPI